MQRSLHTPVKQYLSLMCASYSFLKYLIVESTGLGADWPRPQRDVAIISLLKSISVSISPISPRPSVISVSKSSITLVPTLHGTHLPQDSSAVNSRKNLAVLTIQVLSSITTIPPDPTIAPVFSMASYVTGISRNSSGMQPPEGPPNCTALNFLPFCKPRPIS